MGVVYLPLNHFLLLELHGFRHIVQKVLAILFLTLLDEIAIVI